MRAIVFLLSEILKTALRIEHKLDQVLLRQKTGDNNVFTPKMQNPTPDSITGMPVKYTPVNLPEYQITVMVREPTDAPQTAEPPKTVGE